MTLPHRNNNCRSANWYVTIVLNILTFPPGQCAEANTEVLATLLLSKVRMLLDIIQSIKLRVPVRLNFYVL